MLFALIRASAITFLLLCRFPAAKPSCYYLDSVWGRRLAAAAGSILESASNAGRRISGLPHLPSLWRVGLQLAAAGPISPRAATHSCQVESCRGGYIASANTRATSARPPIRHIAIAAAARTSRFASPSNTDNCGTASCAVAPILPNASAADCRTRAVKGPFRLVTSLRPSSVPHSRPEHSPPQWNNSVALSTPG